VKRSAGHRCNDYWAALPNPAAPTGLTPQQVQGSETANPASDDTTTPHLTTSNPAADAREVVKGESERPLSAQRPRNEELNLDELDLESPFAQPPPQAAAARAASRQEP